MGYTKYIELVKKHKKSPQYKVVIAKSCMDFDDKFYMEVLINPQIKEFLSWDIKIPSFKTDTIKGKEKTIKITEIDVVDPLEVLQVLKTVYSIIKENADTIGHYWFYYDDVRCGSNFITFFQNQNEKWCGEAGIGFCHIYKKEPWDGKTIDFTKMSPLGCFVPKGHLETWGSTVPTTLKCVLESTYSRHGSKLLELIALCEYAIDNSLLLHPYYE